MLGTMIAKTASTYPRGKSKSYPNKLLIQPYFIETENSPNNGYWKYQNLPKIQKC
jgi:hypothetical protein